MSFVTRQNCGGPRSEGGTVLTPASHRWSPRRSSTIGSQRKRNSLVSHWVAAAIAASLWWINELKKCILELAWNRCFFINLQIMDLLKEVAGLKVSSQTHMAVSKLDQILWNIMEHANTGLVVSEFLTSGSLILQLSIYWELVCWTSRFPSRMHHLDPGFQHGPWGPNSPGKNNGFRSISIAIQSAWHKARRCGDWPLVQAFWHCYVLLKQGLLHWSFTDGHVLLKVIIFLHFVWDLPWFADISWRLYIISFCIFFLWCIHWYFLLWVPTSKSQLPVVPIPTEHEYGLNPKSHSLWWLCGHFEI